MVFGKLIVRKTGIMYIDREKSGQKEGYTAFDGEVAMLQKNKKKREIVRKNAKNECIGRKPVNF